jgi:ubiquinone/menaquinone biosynthesis C-methylase UbiE
MNNLTILIYERLLEPMLHSWKSRVAQWIREDSPGVTLDICCGTGKQCRLIAEHSAVVGLDLDLELLKFAKLTAPSISFVCADAGRLPFKEDAFENANISLALHDKPDALRRQIIKQTKAALKPDGRFFIIDFEQPYSWKSRIGHGMVYLIELMAGWEHFSNGREFVTSGGLTSFLKRNNLQTMRKHKSQWGSSGISKNRFLL